MSRELRERIASAIETWLPQRDNRNLSLLAKRSGVSYSTIRRLAMREVEPNRDIAIRIAQITMCPSDFNEFVDEYCSDFKRIFAKSAVDPDAEDQDFFKDARFFPVIILASHASGTNEEEVCRYFGGEAVKRFQELINGGVLSKTPEGKWKAPDVDAHSLERGRRWMKVMIDMCQSENDDLKYTAHAHAAWESLSAEAAKHLHKRTMAFIREVSEIVSEPRNHGDVLVYTGALYNVLKNSEALQ